MRPKDPYNKLYMTEEQAKEFVKYKIAQEPDPFEEAYELMCYLEEVQEMGELDGAAFEADEFSDEVLEIIEQAGYEIVFEGDMMYIFWNDDEDS